MAQTQSNSADTYGWDTVFAIKFSDANQAIKDAKSSPTEFQYTESSSSGDVNVNGKFADWQLEQGGDGELVHMKVPITEGTVSIGGEDTPIDSVTATIEVQLEFLPQPSNAASNKQDLKLKSTAAQGEAVTVVDIQPEPTSFLVKSVLKGALQDWLNANLQEFNHVFATVDLNMQLDNEGFQWLAPTETSYAVADQQTDDGVFGVLSMTENRTAKGLAHQVSPFAIPEKSRAGFLISSERFLSKMLLPGIQVLFQGATAASFKINEDGTAISNVKKVSLQKFQSEKGGDTYQASVAVDDFSVQIEGSELKLEFVDLNYEYRAGIIVHIDFKSWSTLGLDEKEVVQLKEQRRNATSRVTQTAAVVWAEIISGIVIGIGATILGGVVGGAVEGIAEDGAAVVNEEATTDSTAVMNPLNAVANDAEVGFELQAQDETIASDEVAASNEGGNPPPTQQKGCLGRMSPKMKGMIGGALSGTVAGGLLGNIANFMKLSAQGEVDQLPTLAAFAQNSAKAIAFSNASATEFQVTSAELNGSFQMGVEPGFPAPPQA